MSIGKLSLAVIAALAALTACHDEDPATAPRSDAPAAPADAAGAIELSGAVSGTWTTRSPLPSPRADLAAVTVTDAAGGSRFYALGGINANGAILPVCPVAGDAGSVLSR
jgi:hypothetical protein